MFVAVSDYDFDSEGNRGTFAIIAVISVPRFGSLAFESSMQLSSRASMMVTTGPKRYAF